MTSSCKGVTVKTNLLNGDGIGTYLGINRVGGVQGKLEENGMDRRVTVESLDGSNHFRLSRLPGNPRRHEVG